MKNLINYDLEEIQYPRRRNVYNMTTNSSVYKKSLSNRERYCVYCGWNSGCNAKRKKFYGGKIYEDGVVVVTRHPNWKLYKKVPHQWMYSELKKDISTRFYIERDYKYFDFIIN